MGARTRLIVEHARPRVLDINYLFIINARVPLLLSCCNLCPGKRITSGRVRRSALYTRPFVRSLSFSSVCTAVSICVHGGVPGTRLTSCVCARAKATSVKFADKFSFNTPLFVASAQTRTLVVYTYIYAYNADDVNAV